MRWATGHMGPHLRREVGQEDSSRACSTPRTEATEGRWNSTAKAGRGEEARGGRVHGGVVSGIQDSDPELPARRSHTEAPGPPRMVPGWRAQVGGDVERQV